MVSSKDGSDDTEDVVVVSALGGRTVNALMKRAEQLKRWEEAEINKKDVDLKSEALRKVKFPDG